MVCEIPSNTIIDVDSILDGWKRSRGLLKGWRKRFIYEKFKDLWFDVSFKINLDDESIILIKNIFEDTFENSRKASNEIERSEIANKFNKEVRKIIGEDNYDKLLNKREKRIPGRFNFRKKGST